MVGQTKSPRCLGKLVLLCAAAVSVLLGATRTALTQDPQTVFQINGDSANDSFSCVYGTPCDYWNLINLSGSSGVGRGHSALNTFLLGTASTDSFTGGGSKDPNDLSQWAYSASPTPNKDTLNAGYAAAYNQPDFDVIFGADRLSPNGDANIGIWFFQQSVGLSNGSFINTATGTAAHHVNGDVFIVSAFVNGGGTSAIQAYEWDSSCTSAVKNPSPGQCAANNLRVLNTSGIAEAITNTGTVSATWASYSGGTLASPLFFQGGLDITQALGGNVPCFASFLEETRSSQSPTAVLKDFLLGSFPVCSMSVAKECPICSVVNGSSFSWNVDGTVTNTGIATIYNVTVVDDSGTPGSANSSDDLVFNCGTLTPGQSKKWGSTAGAGDCVAVSGSTVSSTTTNPITNGVSASASASPGGGGTPISATASIACGKCTLNPAIGVTKTCQTGVQVLNNTVAVDVTYSGVITNTGNETLTGVTIGDKPDSGTSDSIGVTTCVATTPATSCTVSGGTATLGPGAKVNYQGSYIPTNFVVPTGGGRAQFGDTVNASGTGSLDGKAQVSGPVSATCTLCPFGACPAQ